MPVRIICTVLIAVRRPILIVGRTIIWSGDPEWYKSEKM